MRLAARCILVTALTGAAGLASALALASTSAPSAGLPSLPVPTTVLPTPSLPVPTGVVPTVTLPAPTAPPIVPTAPPVSTAAAPPVPVPGVPAPAVLTPDQAPEAPPKESSSRGDSTGTPAPARAATHATPTPALGVAATSTFRRGSVGARTKPRPILGRVRLERQATLKIRIRQLLPVCRPIGGYAVKARPGSTLLRFPRRIGETTLGVGTYDAHVRLAQGPTVLHVVKRIEADERGVLHAVAVPERVACMTPFAALAAAPGHAASRSSGTPGLHVKSASDRGVVREAAPVDGERPSPSLPSAGSALGTILVAAVLLSFGLFFVASLPQDVYAGGPTTAIGRRRGTIALAGAIVLCAAVGVVIYTWLA
jgi:hypothetical protein